MKKIIEEVNFWYRDGKTKKLPKNLKSLKISCHEDIMTSTIFYDVRCNNYDSGTCWSSFIFI